MRASSLLSLEQLAQTDCLRTKKGPLEKTPKFKSLITTTRHFAVVSLLVSVLDPATKRG
jgi:hypothetical protein